MDLHDLNARWQGFYEEAGEKAVEQGGFVWHEYEHMVVPVAPVCLACTASPATARALLAAFPRAMLVRSTGGLTGEPDPRWYCVLCDTFLPAEAMTLNHRRKIHRGFRDSVVEQVDAALIAREGYDVYLAAFERYRGVAVPDSRESFVRQAEAARHYTDLVDYWGVFQGKRLVGFGIDFRFGDQEVNYSTAKLSPEGLAGYGIYALIYGMNEHYLTGEHRYPYVNAGFRCIAHETRVQDLLMTNLNFHREGCSLSLACRPWVAAALRLARPCRQLVERAIPWCRPLFALDEARMPSGEVP